MDQRRVYKPFTGGSTEISGGNGFSAVSVCEGTDREGAASLAAKQDSGKAAMKPAQEMKKESLCLPKCGSKTWDFGGMRHTGSSLDSTYSVQLSCDRTVIFVLPGSFPAEIYIRS